MTKMSDDKLAVLAFLAITVFLGGNFVAVKFSNAELPPFWGAALRFWVAAILLYMIATAKNIALPKGGALKGAILYGITAFGFTYGLAYWALLGVGASTFSVIFATLPLFTLILAVAIGQEKITPKGLTGAFLVLIGIGFVFRNQFAFNVSVTYLAIAVVSVITAALSGIVIKHFPKSNPVAINTVAMAVGATILLAASFITREAISLPSEASTWAALGYLLVSTVVVFVLMVWLLSKWAASTTSYTLVLAPLVTIVFATLLLNESITADFLIGGTIVLLGVYTAISSKTQKDSLNR